METVKIKNVLTRPRVFSVVNADGSAGAVRLRAGEALSIDARLLTPEIVRNVKKVGCLLLLEGKIPAKLNPYPEKKEPKEPKKAPPENPGAGESGGAEPPDAGADKGKAGKGAKG